MIPREGYLQIAYIARKGSDARLRAQGSNSSAGTSRNWLPASPAGSTRSPRWTTSSISTYG
ncbi:hypothetical protein [Plantactinospora veratri]